MNLTFGEQLLLLLKRKNMSIQEFSELLEARTGVPCPVEHLKQQLKKDNFLEQDMSILAAALDRQVVISLEPISTGEPLEDFSLFSNFRPADNSIQKKPEELHTAVADNIPLETDAPGEKIAQAEINEDVEDSFQMETITVSEDSSQKENMAAAKNSSQPEIHISVEDNSQTENMTSVEDSSQSENMTSVENSSQSENMTSVEDSSWPETKEDSEPSVQPASEQDMMIRQVTQSLKEAVQKRPAKSRKAENAAGISLSPDSINPYTQEEYLNNTVRKHPDQDHYIQVYDISEHKWIDVPENYFQKFQYVKRKIMGKDYTPPIYI